MKKADANQPAIVGALRAIGATEPKAFGVWRCATCGKEARATVHQLRKTYCSKRCMASGYTSRMAGESNPNYRRAGLRTCAECGVEFQSYHDRKYCGKECYRQSQMLEKTRQCPVCDSAFDRENKLQRFCSGGCVDVFLALKAEKKEKAILAKIPKPKKPSKPPKEVKIRVRKQRPPPKWRRMKIEKTCQQCGVLYLSTLSQKRIYCCYQCFLDSGGAKRAGRAAVMATRKYGAKKDANHREIFSAISRITAVMDLSAQGGGLPDGLALCGDRLQLFDVKNPKTGYGRRGLNPVQKDWASSWKGGPVFLIYSIEEAERFARGELDGLKRFPDGQGAAA